jgi:hypothetical protein
VGAAARRAKERKRARVISRAETLWSDTKASFIRFIGEFFNAMGNVRNCQLRWRRAAVARGSKE